VDDSTMQVQGDAAAAVVPPCGNTGAVAPLHPDWLAFTWFDGSSLFDVFPTLERWSMVKRDGGLNGYKEVYDVGPLVVMTAGRAGMGTHVVLSSGALADVAGLYRDGLSGFIADMNGLSRFKVSRLDVAIDVFDSGISRNLIAEHLRTGSWVGLLRTWREWSDFGKDNKPVGGTTFYVGSTSGEVLLRIYDKRLERLSHAAHFSSKSRSSVKDWWRFEWQFRGDGASLAFDLLSSADYAGLLSMCLRYCDFKDSQSASRIERCDRALWWQGIVGAIEPSAPVRDDVQWSYSSTKEWLVSTVAKAFAKVVECEYSSAPLTYELLARGREAMATADWEECKAEIDSRLVRNNPLGQKAAYSYRMRDALGLDIEDAELFMEVD